MYRKYIGIVLLIFFFVIKLIIFPDRNPGNTSWTMLLCLSSIYSFTFGFICSLLLKIEFIIKKDYFMLIMGVVALYFSLVPIIYYSPINIITKLENFMMFDKSDPRIIQLMTILLGLIVGGFIMGEFKGNRTKASVQDI